jgi:hypothetical protein
MSEIMDKFELKSTNKTPEINLNPENGFFVISGRSIPENSIEFYKPVNEWLENYASNPANSTVLEIRLEYFNTSSSKCLVELFRKIEAIHRNGKSVEIHWFYDEEDEDMLESGEDFKEIIKVPISMIEVKDE